MFVYSANLSGFLLDVVASGIGSIGGVFLLKTFVKTGIEETVKHSLSKHLEAYKSELTAEIERLKLSLKNEEMFFSKQLESLTKLSAISRNLLPKKRSPDADWSDACESMAYFFSETVDTLNTLLCDYESVLPNNVLKDIESAISIATDGQFEFYMGDDKERIPQPNNKATDGAGEMYETLKRAVQSLQRAVDSQLDSRKTALT